MRLRILHIPRRPAAAYRPMQWLWALSVALPLMWMPLLLGACSGNGGGGTDVLSVEEMAQLMADIHIAEAVVDLNRNEFSTDSQRLVLRQSVYATHGVTPEQADSSFKWYGYHVDEYMKVYDRTIEILKEREGELLAASGQRVVAQGDSVDLWPYTSSMEFSRNTPSRIVNFSIPADSNWRNGDVFTLRFIMASSRKPVMARMVVEYADGTSSFSLQAGKNRGEGHVSIRVDSTLTPLRVAGYLLVSPQEGETVRLDSISLTRMRSELSRSYFAQRPFRYGIQVSRPKPVADSAATSAPSSGAASAPAPSSPGASSPSKPSTASTATSGSRNVDNAPRRESTAQEALRKQREARGQRK